jgi:hypothetical protein
MLPYVSCSAQERRLPQRKYATGPKKLIAMSRAQRLLLPFTAAAGRVARSAQAVAASDS